MYAKFPPNVQKTLDAAVLHLWDKRRPEPDLDSLSEWLEGDGWDDVVSLLVGCCIYTDRIMDDLNDETLLEYSDIADLKKITHPAPKVKYLVREETCIKVQILKIPMTSKSKNNFINKLRFFININNKLINYFI